MKKTIASFLLATSVIAVSATAVQAAPKQYVNIGTAGIGGGYYPTGGFICNALNKTRKSSNHNIRCSVESTAGSVANLRSIQSGDLDVAMAQGDWQYHSWNGTSKFEDVGANKDLRFVFSMHQDISHLVARKEINANNLTDLKDRSINTGNVGSGTEASFHFAFDLYGEKPEDFFKQTTKLTSREQASALCDGKIDAYYMITGILSSTITEASNTCDVTILNWMDSNIENMIEKYPYFGVAKIPAGTYKGQDEEVISWGMPATIVASANTDEEVIYQLVKAVFDNFEDFKKQSTMYAAMTREGAVKNGKSVPFHAGAERYFREVGLIK